jgi:hypothetical protein
MAYHGNAVVCLDQLHHSFHLLLEVVAVDVTNSRILKR